MEGRCCYRACAVVPSFFPTSCHPPDLAVSYLRGRTISSVLQPNLFVFVVTTYPVSTGIDNQIAPKWENVMRMTRCRRKLHIGPLIGGARMLDELSICSPPEDKKGRKGIKYHNHIRSVSRESSAI